MHQTLYSHDSSKSLKENEKRDVRQEDELDGYDGIIPFTVLSIAIWCIIILIAFLMY